MNYEHEFKMTEGTARQEFRDGECIGQEFIAGDEVNWEDGAGEHLSDPTHLDVYQPFGMAQPGDDVAALKAEIISLKEEIGRYEAEDYDRQQGGAKDV